MTSPIWKIEDSVSFSKFDVTEVPSSSILKQLNEYYDRYTNIVSSSLLKYLFFGVGTGLFIIVFSFMLMIAKQKLNLEAYLPFLLVISNTLIVMLLITGGEIRFVCSQMFCAIPLLIYSLKWKNHKNVNKNE